MSPKTHQMLKLKYFCGLHKWQNAIVTLCKKKKKKHEKKDKKVPQRIALEID